MALELIHNTKTKLVLLCLAAIVLLYGCDGKYGKYPYDRALHWNCSDPEFSIEWFTTESGLITKCAAVINWNSKEKPVYVDFYSNFFSVLPTTSDHYDHRLLTGTWKYRGEDLVLIIEEDFLFYNQYEELVFSPVS